jgi:hypothetical protein
MTVSGRLAVVDGVESNRRRSESVDVWTDVRTSFRMPYMQ